MENLVKHVLSHIPNSFSFLQTFQIIMYHLYIYFNFDIFFFSCSLDKSLGHVNFYLYYR